MMSKFTNRLRKTLKISILTLFVSFLNISAFCNEEKSDAKFNASAMIVHHIGDSHEWHLGSIANSHLTIPLPVILYSSTKGFVSFSSSKFHNESQSYQGYILEHEHIVSEDKSEKVYDLSITKNVASMLICATIMLSVFLTVSSSFNKNRGNAPKGIQSIFEPLIIFVRDEIAIPNIGEKKAMRYLPYLLTIFFFIWINNMLGLLPQGANVSGNIAFTMVLAVFTLIITNLSGNKSYWGHILKAPGVPLPLLIIMTPVEIIGIFTKPFALMIRLFANITAGHIIILSILSFIFIFKNIAVAGISVPFAVVMSLLEVFVAALQAYIFTLLSALFIGQAVAEHDHHADHH